MATATLTKAAIADLHKGNASVSLLPVGETGEVDLSTLDFTGADQIFTIKDSLEITQNEPDNELRLDQGNQLVDIDPGSIAFSGNFPTNAKEVFDYFYEQGAAVTSIKGQTGTEYEGQGYSLQPKIVQASVLIESESKQTAILIAIADITARFGGQESGVLYLAVEGTSTTNMMAGAGDFAILKQKTATN